MELSLKSLNKDLKIDLYSKLISNEENLALVGLSHVDMPIDYAFAKEGLNLYLAFGEIERIDN